METTQAVEDLRRSTEGRQVISRNQVVHNRTLKGIPHFKKRKQERREGYVHAITLFNERRKAYILGSVNTAILIGVGWLLFLR